ncbi:hypothetical protein ACFPDQ_03885 [Pseudofrancisella aestuarii]|uniref:Uncharacterized protein n=1 Tax=Pseudofrancisella aestuarii TaxID=2670347 RepID=A0ABV9TAN8_9GAMM|nr:hypothetical protein [Pseudofrancisella aestuarii]
MLNYYGLLATNLFIIYLITRILGFLPKKNLTISVFILFLLFNTINVESNVNIAEIVFGFIGYLSISSSLLLIILIFNKLYSSNKTTFTYTSIAFLMILTIFYVSFFINSYTLYDIGFTPYIILFFIFTYGLILLKVSKNFILFNCIILMSCVISFTELLQLNIWNYLVDPCLLIICIIELVRSLVIRFRNKQSNLVIKTF